MTLPHSPETGSRSRCPEKFSKGRRGKTYHSIRRLLEIHGSTLGEEQGRGRERLRDEHEVEGGMLWARFTTEAQRIVALASAHSCRVTIYNRPPFLPLAVSRLRKIIKRPLLLFLILPYVPFSLCVSASRYDEINAILCPSPLPLSFSL